MPAAHLPMRIWEMLRSLRDTQAAFAAHFSGHDQPDLVAAIGGDSRTALQRLQLHRHHVTRSVGAALAATFPTVAAVVGQEFFGLLARDFMVGTALERPRPQPIRRALPSVSRREARHAWPALPGRCRASRLGTECRLPCWVGTSAVRRRPGRSATGFPAEPVGSIANGFVVDRIGLSSRSDLAGIATRRAGRQGRSCRRSGLSGDLPTPRRRCVRCARPRRSSLHQISLPRRSPGNRSSIRLASRGGF